jgi:hypothetical protein
MIALDRHVNLQLRGNTGTASRRRRGVAILVVGIDSGVDRGGVVKGAARNNTLAAVVGSSSSLSGTVSLTCSDPSAYPTSSHVTFLTTWCAQQSPLGIREHDISNTRIEFFADSAISDISVCLAMQSLCVQPATVQTQLRLIRPPLTTIHVFLLQLLRHRISASELCFRMFYSVIPPPLGPKRRDNGLAAYEPIAERLPERNAFALGAFIVGLTCLCYMIIDEAECGSPFQ